jgi:hypothetical protein
MNQFAGPDQRHQRRVCSGHPGKGSAIVVYNPLNVDREDIVKRTSLSAAAHPRRPRQDRRQGSSITDVERKSLVPG